MSSLGQLPPLLPHSKLARDRYTIERVLGKGGFGYVYLAYTPQKQQVAIKQCIDQDPQTLTQFGHELAVLKTLAAQSQFFPQVIEEFSAQLPGSQASADPKYMFAVMEFVPGSTLESEIEARLAQGKGGFPEQEAIHWISQVLAALEIAHSCTPPIIHRDIKPANIMLLPDRKQIKIIDVGIAKIGGSGTKTQRGAAAASDGFAPPEQYAQASQTDHRSDIYAVGATLYYLLTGTVPVDAMGRSSGIQGLTPLRLLNSHVTPIVEAAVMRAMEIEVTQRFQSATEMLATLQGRSVTSPQICPQCGALNQMNARFCQKCRAPIQNIALFLANSRAQTVAELPPVCERAWVEAVGQLITGKIDQWLQNIGPVGQPPSAVLQQMRTRFPNDPNLQLDGLLSSIDPQRTPPQLQIQSTTPPIPIVEQGTAHSILVAVTNAGRCYLTGSVTTNEPWVTVKPTAIQCAAGQTQTLKIDLNTAMLVGSRGGRKYVAQASVTTNGGSQILTYPLQVTALPQLRVAPDPIDFGTVAPGQGPIRTLQIFNQGVGTLQAFLQPAAHWLAVTPTTVTIAEHSQQVVQVQLVARQLSERKAYTSEIYVNANQDGLATVQVSVNLSGPYSPSCAPGVPLQNIDALLSWCDANWKNAVQLLRSGELYFAVSYLGEPAHSKQRNPLPWHQILETVAESARLPDANLGLESALRALGAASPQYSDNWEQLQAELGFGLIPDPRWMMPWWEGPRQVTFKIRNDSRGYLHGHLKSLSAWLVIDTPGFGCLAGQEARIPIRVYKKRRRLSGLKPDLFDLQIG